MNSNRYPPGPRSFLSLRVYRDLFRDPLGFLTKISRQYGDIVYMSFGGRRDYLLLNPEDIQTVILAPDIFRRSTSRVLRKILK